MGQDFMNDQVDNGHWMIAMLNERMAYWHNDYESWVT